MKIAQVLASQGDGGLEKHVYELSIALSEQGHDVTVLAAEGFIRKLPSQIRTVTIPCQYSRYAPRLLWALGSALRTNKFDIVHAQANKATSMVNALRHFIPGRRVATLHNIKKRIASFQTFDQVIAVSNYLARPFPDDKVTVIYNGIANTFFPGEARDRLNTPPLLLAVGRLVQAKGFDVLIEAVANLPVVLRIVGDGPERVRLQSLIERTPTAGNIQLLGARSDVPELMQHADAVIISSRREGFSYVLNEALLAHCRVLSTDVPVANEVLPDRLIVPINDPLALRERLQDLLDAPRQWSALMQKPHELAEQLMTLTAMTDQTIALYQKVLAT